MCYDPALFEREPPKLVFDFSPDRVALGLTTYVVLLFSLSVHESAHGWAALKLGDDTAQRQGRISLNPLDHIDVLGTLFIPLIQIFTGFPLLGWAKPTPYEPRNFRRDYSLRQGHMVVAGAGPLSNMLLALLFTAAFFVIVRTGAIENPQHPIVIIVAVGIEMNVVLALFNLVPIPPLDGSKVASYGLPATMGEQYDRVMEPYGHIVLLVLFMTGLLGRVLAPVTNWFVLTLFRLAS